MNRPADFLAREAIVSQIDQNMIVEASAGTGKTESLCRRIANCLLSQSAPPEQFAAITFTRKAAAELKGRLRLVIERAISTGDERAKQRGREVLGQLESLFIGTIHSFCSRLLREHPIDAGIMPNFRELEKPEYSEMMHDALLEVIHEFRETEPSLALEILGSSVKWKQIVPVFEVICQQPDVSFAVSPGRAPDASSAAKALERFMAQIETWMPDPIPEQTTCDIQKRWRKLRYRALFLDPREPASVARCLELWRSGLKPTQLNWPGAGAERKELCKQVQIAIDDFASTTAAPFLEQWRDYLYRALIPLLVKARERFREEREQSARLDYGDLLLLSAKLLRENLAVRRKLQAKFRWIFVDEFQDTDPLQAEVLLLLSSESRYEGADWQSAPLRQGSLFVVGDPKQSIYRFRRADIELFERVKERIVSCGGQSLTLSASFRSTPEICNWSNTVFSKLLPEQATHTQAKFSPLVAVGENVTSSFSGLYACTTDTPRGSEVSEAESEQLAVAIVEAVGRQEYQWGDFLILTSRRSELLHFHRALQARGAPTEITGGEPEESKWVRLFLRLLHALANPDDAVAVVGILRSSLYGLDDETLFLHRKSGGCFGLGSSDDRGEDLVLGALADLQQMREWVQALPVGAAAERVMDHTGILALSFSEGGEAEDAPALVQLVHQLRTLSAGGQSLGRVLDILELRDREFPLALNAGKRDVVRVMNLHQAKGLQARVVILAAPTSGLSERVGLRVVRDEDGSRGFLSMRDGHRLIAEPTEWKDHEREELEFLRAERVRLLYVAVTRAKETLVVGRWSGTHRGATRPWQQLEEFLPESREFGAEESVASPEPALKEIKPEEADTARLERITRWANCSRPTWSRTSVTAQSKEQKLARTTFSVPAEVESQGPGAGAVWGELIHRLLEQLVRNPEFTNAQLLTLAQWYSYEAPEMAPLIPRAVDTVRDVTRSDFWQSVLTAKSKLVEVPFGVALEGGQLVFGVVDLALETEEGWDLIDYKTDRKNRDALIGLYAGQIRQYAAHWAGLAGNLNSARLFRVRSRELTDDLST